MDTLEWEICWLFMNMYFKNVSLTHVKTSEYLFIREKLFEKFMEWKVKRLSSGSENCDYSYL